MSIMKLLGLTRDRDPAGDGAPGTSTETVRRIVDALNDLPAERATQIGAFAGAEDQVIRQIADELLLDHPDFSEVRGRYREHLSVLKKQDDTDD